MFFFVALLVLACICCVCCSCARTHGCLTNVFFLCVLDSTPLVVGLLYVGAVCLLFVGAIKWGLCVTTRGVCLEGLVGVVNAPPAVLSFLSSGCPELRSAASSPPPLPRHARASSQAHRRPTSRPLRRCHPPTAKASRPLRFCHANGHFSTLDRLTGEEKKNPEGKKKPLRQPPTHLHVHQRMTAVQKRRQSLRLVLPHVCHQVSA